MEGHDDGRGGGDDNDTNSAAESVEQSSLKPGEVREVLFLLAKFDS